MIKKTSTRALLPAVLILAAVVSSPVIAAPAAQAEDSVTYVMKQGDTLFTLAERYFARTQDYRKVQRLNRVADPFRISTGRLLRIPVVLLKSQPLGARVAAFRGDVAVTGAGANGAPTPGMALASGMLVQTGATGTMTMILTNGSRITFPSRSRVRIRAMRTFLLNGATDVDLMIEHGRAETVVSPLKDANSRFRLRTPVAVSAVRGTTLRVAYEPETGVSLTEVAEGKVSVASDRSGGGPLLEAGFGAVVGAGGDVARQALLPAVEVEVPGKVQREPVVALALKPVTGASRYRTQLASDAGFVDILEDRYDSEPKASFTNVPNGNWFVRAQAVGESGLQGLSQSYSLSRRLTTVGGALEPLGPGQFGFKWFGDGDGNRLYRFQLLAAPDAPVALVDETGLAGQQIVLTTLPPGTYFWRVGVQQYADGVLDENWTSPEKLIVSKPE